MAIADPTEPPLADELLASARAGDAQAFCRLIEPLQGRLLRQAAALSGDLHAAEDLISEVRIRAWKNLGRYNETCRLSTWLYAILLHCHQEAARRARSRPISMSRLPNAEAKEIARKQENQQSPAESPADEAAQNDMALRLSRCVEILPEKHRDVIRLRFFEDASLPDMAAMLGCSVGTVKSRLHHALQRIRKMKMNLAGTGGNQAL